MGKHDPSRCRRRYAGCEKDPLPNRRICRSCAEIDREKQDKFRAQKKAIGQCFRCQLTATHGDYCEAHAMEKAAQQKSYYHTRKTLGLCPHCGIADTGGLWCDECKQRVRAE